ncbi:ABC-F family ATP-binding cassette domain-containing protein [Saccharococcus caldoxylosilyticus]|uniref:Putative ABC transporter ATP-binding protein n=1 Tax=Parageobacillus caldoxylosilyticus NBRC 107762 TaxID=1220594 RepID=A0A023DJI2_9BACL|nr:ABC-F family ATP-binding cassette domain-containing protein [Parageobacillus caldoxylosilyticus]MBB3854372.1 ATP-binding cassette subfamily F protein 3 [Parageobacillus caldoxylosilyticus]GAJ41429.1 putative ABC transporter ATP-binding protein [Parageobacillus caldoxylosilyticus NBRC 107762]
MIILQVNQLTKYFGADLILSNIKLEIQSKDRIALVGRNGAGKSTLLKIIAGEMSYDSGEIIKPKEVTIGYLAQDSGLHSSLSIWEEMMTVFAPLKAMEKQLRAMEMQMGDPDLLADVSRYEKLLKDYGALQERYKEQGGYQYEADIRSILHGLQFSKYDYMTTPVQSLSGGQRTRLALGKLLLMKPDLLILDEPTNHLDLETLTWLEQYLQTYPGAILIVSHDRYFLDKVVTQVYELSRATLKRYSGNYSRYLEQRAEEYERERKLYEKQQEEIAKLQDFIQRNIARASTTKRAQSRRKRLEKMERMEKPIGDEKAASFSFEIERQSGNDVLIAEDVAVGYDADQPIFRNVRFRITRGESVALIGPNGIGKSTLLKAIVNKLPLQAGHFRYGSNVQIGYYDQNQADLSSNKRVLDELWDEFPDKTEKEIRTVLGNFLFSGDDVLKHVSELSGGEKARLALAKLMMQKANFLVLDEPTNHLDLDSKEVLENALIEYPGTILFVSHDRYFINRIATKIYELSSDGITEYLGDYDYYIAKKEEMLELERLAAAEQRQTNANLPDGESTKKLNYEQEKEAKKLERQRKRRIEEIEAEISELEQQIAHVEEQLCDPDIYQDHEKVQQLTKENEEMKQKLDLLLVEWEELHTLK